MALTRVPPGGSAISLAEGLAALRERAPAAALRAGLALRLGATGVTLHASGREAMRVAFASLAAASGRAEVVLPAYVCFSVPASAVAAGLRVRLVDVDARGWIDPAALEKLPLERAAAVVIANLFGVPEPFARVRALADAAGAAVVDDAAQALGASGPEGPAGGRGACGVLSFGRGKPLSALGGGAVAWTGARPPQGSGAEPRPRRGAALARAAAWNAARTPAVFRWLAAVPALRIGETVYDPAFARGAIDGASLCLAAAVLPGLDAAAAARAARAAALADALETRTRFTPLVAVGGATGVAPRLALLAPSSALRGAALAALSPFGASPLYPSSLDALPALAPHLEGTADCPGARELAARLLTLPTHAGLSARGRDEAVRRLAELG